MCRSPIGSTEMLERASTLVHQVVAADASCWATFDPATTMIASTVAYSLDADVTALERFLDLEYRNPGPLAFRELHRKRRIVAVHGEDDACVPGAVDTRAHEHLAPMGIAGELRWLVTVGETAWGGAGMMRSSARPYTVEERHFLEHVGGTLGAGLRAAMVRGRAAKAPRLGGPAVLVFEKAELTSATADGQAFLDAVASLDRGNHTGQPMIVRAVARAAAAGHTVCQRVFVPGLGPTTLRGAPLGAGNAVVTVEPSRPGEVVALVADAYALSPRERDVVDGVLRGLSTKEIASELHVSTYTVQDHLKSIFAKASVDSRRELVADVFFAFAAPRLALTDP